MGRNDRDWRDERGQRNSFDDRDRYGRGGEGDHERGFFERAGDEISSWFGDDEAERRREMDERNRGGSGEYRDHGRRPYASQPPRPSRDRDDFSRRPFGARPHERGELGRDLGRRGPEYDRDQGASYRPMTGDYGRATEDRFERGSSGRGAAYGAAASGVTAAHDRHYGEWRQRQIDQLDRDYDDYRREHQSKFESDFSSWRSTRQTKRDMIGTIKEHMQVVGADDAPLGTVDKVRADRLILTKADSPDGKHHSLNVGLVERVEGDRVILAKSADEAKALFGDEDRDRALYERDDQREAGAHMLNKSFSGTY